MNFAAHSAESAEEREERRAAKTVAGVDGGHLKAFIERIERLEEEKCAIGDDIKAVYAEAKANGYDAKIMRRIVARRKKDADRVREEEEILDLYLAALGEA